MAETILIIEDEPEFAALVELWMTRAGYRTVTARTGPDGLRRFYDERPDLIILDVALPGFDGWQLIGRFREFSRVPILMVTARGSEADKIRGLKLGADDYITKPLSFPELSARVEAALRRAATRGPGATTATQAPRPRRRSRRSPGAPARHRGPPHPDRVPVARPPRGARRATRYPSPGPRRRLGRGLRSRRPPAADDDPQPAAEAGCRRSGEPYITTEFGLGYRLAGPASRR